MPQSEKLVWSVSRPNGEQLQARISEFKGVQYLSIRSYYQDRVTEEFKPGKNGINIPIDEAESLFAACESLANEVEEILGPCSGDEALDGEDCEVEAEVDA